jgi:hypothetical protein
MENNMRPIEELKYMIEVSKSQGLRVWKIIHKSEWRDDVGYYNHWYELIYSEVYASKDLSLFPTHPMKDEFYKAICDGKYPEIKLLYNETEMLVYRLKYDIGG